MQKQNTPVVKMNIDGYAVQLVAILKWGDNADEQVNTYEQYESGATPMRFAVRYLEGAKKHKVVNVDMAGLSSPGGFPEVCTWIERAGFHIHNNLEKPHTGKDAAKAEKRLSNAQHNAMTKIGGAQADGATRFALSYGWRAKETREGSAQFSSRETKPATWLALHNAGLIYGLDGRDYSRLPKEHRVSFGYDSKRGRLQRQVEKSSSFDSIDGWFGLTALGQSVVNIIMAEVNAATAQHERWENKRRNMANGFGLSVELLRVLPTIVASTEYAEIVGNTARPAEVQVNHKGAPSSINLGKVRARLYRGYRQDAAEWTVSIDKGRNDRDVDSAKQLAMDLLTVTHIVDAIGS